MISCKGLLVIFTGDGSDFSEGFECRGRHGPCAGHLSIRHTEVTRSAAVHAGKEDIPEPRVPNPATEDKDENNRDAADRPSLSCAPPRLQS